MKVDTIAFSVKPKNEWDICGGVALILAVGKVYRRFDDKELRFNRKDPLIPCGGAAGPAPLVQELFDNWKTAQQHQRSFSAQRPK